MTKYHKKKQNIKNLSSPQNEAVTPEEEKLKAG
jgi:hypothetical protein